MNENNKYFAEFVVILFVVGLVLAIGFMLHTNQPIENKPIAKVQSRWGCLPTTMTPEEFDNQQYFNQIVLGYHYVRC